MKCLTTVVTLLPRFAVVVDKLLTTPGRFLKSCGVSQPVHNENSPCLGNYLLIFSLRSLEKWANQVSKLKISKADM